MKFIFAIFVLWLCFVVPVNAQQTNAFVTGKVTDSLLRPVKGVRVLAIGNDESVLTNEEGIYKLPVFSGKALQLEFSFLNIAHKKVAVAPLQPGQNYVLDIILSPELTVGTVKITQGAREERRHMQKIDPRQYEALPNASGGIEALLKTLPSVSSNNELSSQYSVRGGNYDENLVYINDVEIFRPLLVRAGQQEGLSIINSDLVRTLNFSAGGFEARYGDKLSSVLDIQYKEPDSFASFFSGSLMGASAHIEGSSQNHRFKYLAGARYRSNAYLLNSLDVRGDYRPTFADLQSLLSYDVNENLKISWLAYYGNNHYLSIPQSQETTFGTVSQVIRLKVFFDGQEILSQRMWLHALTTEWKPSNRTRYKFITSAYQATENETFDIIGQYNLQQLENNPGSQDFGEVKYTLGIGGYLDHARNRLTSNIYNAEIKARHEGNSNVNIDWGLKFQHERLEDKLAEYRYVDSADYSLPQNNNGLLEVWELISSRNKQAWNRFSGYVQNSWTVSEKYRSYLSAGIRANYWDFNNEMIWSPRLQLTYEPNAHRITDEDTVNNFRDVRFKFAAGAYHQPPFYRELRNLSGQLNPEIRAQKSYHLVAGSEVMLTIGDRPFRWTTEVYYKFLKDIITYELDNVRIRYYAENNANGYATGVEMQLYGEFVRNIPSWASIAVMKTQEDIVDDVGTRYNETTGEWETYSPGFLPRPTDQRLRFALFFQDFLPNNPSYKVHLNLVYGSRLPFGPPDYNRYKDTLRMPPYRRVDVGFSKQLIGKGQKSYESGFLRNLNSVWLSAEIFNLFDINNTIGYFWVRDVGGNQWAIPRYLTSRRLNIQLQIKF